ncbi:MAG: TIGR03905 family TSCPD domain-containing protein [Clostridia bacterium]|nr:TIGR03905 family TSCPD domain-containing protein [Clostridia bacterium]
MEYRYKPSGVCSTEMIFNIDEENIIQDLKVVGGCNGNLKGISKLIRGMKIDDVIERLSGVLCGYRNTSCPDQIARALKEYKANK